MTYSEELADRVRKVLKRRRGLTERKMFGGICFMVNGNMCCGVLNDELILRLGSELGPLALQSDHTRAFDFTGKKMTGFAVVEAIGCEAEEDLRRWLFLAAEFAKSLPPK